MLGFYRGAVKFFHQRHKLIPVRGCRRLVGAGKTLLSGGELLIQIPVYIDAKLREPTNADAGRGVNPYSDVI